MRACRVLRQLAGNVVEILQWPERQASLVGDWTVSTRSEIEAGNKAAAAAAPTAKRKKTTISVRQRFYAKVARRHQQIAARRRYLTALSAGFQNFPGGIEAITASTTWEEIFPMPAPPWLQPYVGEPVFEAEAISGAVDDAEEDPSLQGDAAQKAVATVAAAPATSAAAERPKRSRTPKASGS